jgi:anthranilate phosphoribosyltransferase
MKISILNKTLEIFRSGRDLPSELAEPALDALISETDERPIADVLRAWNEKGISEDEIFSFASILRTRMKRVASTHKTFVDIVGTGGSRSKTFNVSTAAAFVVAGAGVPVAKHGNKAATSNSGSADVLSELGIDPMIEPEAAEKCLNGIGICFMFAPNHHRLSPTLAKVRRSLGKPTIFNLVGPLCNPASAPHQLIGVSERSMVKTMASALARLGTTRSWVVHSADGLDEISIGTNTFVAEVNGETVTTFTVSPGDLGMEPESNDSIKAASPVESADLIRAVLGNNLRNCAAENIVIINSMAAVYLTGRVKDTNEASYAVKENIRNGNSMRKLDQLAEALSR